jgi:hypothetical protein
MKQIDIKNILYVSPFGLPNDDIYRIEKITGFPV